MCAGTLPSMVKLNTGLKLAASYDLPQTETDKSARQDKLGVKRKRIENEICRLLDIGLSEN
jgi:hypothetical protein